MNKRFAWNFEINVENPFKLPTVDHFIPTPNKWESRFFWSDDQIITLQGLSENFLKLSNYQIKHRSDIYYLLPQADYNLKLRHNQLYYKPTLMKKPLAIAYGKKIKLEEYAPALELPGIDTTDVTALIAHIKQKGMQIKVEKEALLFQFETSPPTKLELAWLSIANTNYFSVSIESRAFSMVETITHHLLGNKPTSDYVTFLKGII